MAYQAVTFVARRYARKAAHGAALRVATFARNTALRITMNRAKKKVHETWDNIWDDEKKTFHRPTKKHFKRAMLSGQQVYKDKNLMIKRIDISADRIKRTVKQIGEDKNYVKVGYPYESRDTRDIYPRTATTVLDVALSHEYGRGDRYYKSVKRPFLEPAVEGGRDNYIDYQNKLIVDLSNDKITVKKILERMGMIMVRDIKNYVRQRKVRPMSRRAITEAGTTLYDTGQLVNSITYVVKEKSD